MKAPDTKAVPNKTIIILSGILAGAITGLITALIEWLMFSAIVELINIRYMYMLYLLYSFNGLWWGLLGGLITACLKSYWPKITQPKHALLFWLFLLGSCGLIVGLLVGNDKGLMKAGRLVFAGTIIGGFFGIMLSIIAQLITFYLPGRGRQPKNSSTGEQ